MLPYNLELAAAAVVVWFYGTIFLLALYLRYAARKEYQMTPTEPTEEDRSAIEEEHRAIVEEEQTEPQGEGGHSEGATEEGAEDGNDNR